MQEHTATRSTLITGRMTAAAVGPVAGAWHCPVATVTSGRSALQRCTALLVGLRRRHLSTRRLDQLAQGALLGGSARNGWRSGSR